MKTKGTCFKVFLEQAQEIKEFIAFHIYYRLMMFDQYSFNSS